MGRLASAVTLSAPADLTMVVGDGDSAAAQAVGSKKKFGVPKQGEKKPKPPPLEGPVFLYFADMGQEDVARAAAAETKTEVRQILKQCMGVDQTEGYRTEILCDLHYHNYSFCVSRDFSADKLSTFLSIMKRTLRESVEKNLSHDGAFDVFQSWLLKHSVERPPLSVGIFAFEDVQAITNYVHTTFFRHYKLYMYTYVMRSETDSAVDRRTKGFAIPKRQFPLRLEDEDDPKTNPAFAHLFRPSEYELAEQALRKMQEPPEVPEDRPALIKRKVAEGVQDLMVDFDAKLKAQDERFQELLDKR